MSRRLRVALALICVAVIFASLFLLAYAVWPAGQGATRERATLAPTLFAPPQSP